MRQIQHINCRAHSHSQGLFQWGVLVAVLLSASGDIGCGREPEHRPNPVRESVVDHLDAGSGLSSPRTRQGIALPSGDIWVATEKALDRLRDGRFVDSYDHSHPAPIPVGRINAIATDGTGATWIGTSDGLVRFEDGAFTESFTGLPDSRVLSLLSTDDAMLVGTWHGLARIANGHPSASTLGGGLPDRPVTTMLAGDSLWVGFADSGLWVGSLAGPFTPVVESWQDQALTVSSLTLDPAGDVWIGTSGAGLLRWRSSGTVESILPSANILSATIDSTGEIWVGSNSGVYRWRGSSLSQWSTPQDSIAVTAFARLDDRMLAGTWGEGLLNCDDIGNCSAAGLDDGEVVDIAVIDGTVWVTTTEGLIVVDDRTETGPRNQVLKASRWGPYISSAATSGSPPKAEACTNSIARDRSFGITIPATVSREPESSVLPMTVTCTAKSCGSAPRWGYSISTGCSSHPTSCKSQSIVCT